jgi:hypothetical protein
MASQSGSMGRVATRVGDRGCVVIVDVEHRGLRGKMT